ncbi:MAG: glycogen debranching enzyme family protein [Armatimonadetes bacterium]|nr:glycogen debranching enzyme family protein [Armatimonadota bacterium]
MKNTLTLDSAALGDLNLSLSREWLVTNGIGGYASSTIAGCNTRRYHGLLVAALHPPLRRTVLLAKVEESVLGPEGTLLLGTNEYAEGVIYPEGYKLLEGFSLERTLPVFIYRAGGGQLVKRVWMACGQNTTYISYTLDGEAAPVRLRLTLLCNHRDFHGDTRGHLDWRFGIEQQESGIAIRAYEGAHPWWAGTDAGWSFSAAPAWYWSFLYRTERERGLHPHEDCFSPGCFEGDLLPGRTVTLIASTGDQAALMLPEESLAQERERQSSLIEGGSFVKQRLSLAADQFIVSRPVKEEAGCTVIAGYHWFGDWGRDTMISLPDLLIRQGRQAEARSVLLTFARYIDRGMLPNRFPDSGETPEYNTVDATLWYFEAIRAYLFAFPDDASLLPRLYDRLADIIDWHWKGTRYHIRADSEDGLLFAGEPGVQLTWMDARVGDWVVTPRIGKPVEINALWYNALRCMERWAQESGRDAAPYREWAEKVRLHFARKFWHEADGYFFDVAEGPLGNDASLRPNQIFALSLHFCGDLLFPRQAASVLAAVRESLLTPYGLRTLSPGDPNYAPRCAGSVWERDGAYHQGTVWPWLLGGYADAVLRWDPESWEAERKRLLSGLEAHLTEAGVGSVSEIFDGEPPHTPRGCIAQAWSVGAWLRVIHLTPSSAPGRIQAEE